MYKEVNKTSRHPKKGSHFDRLALGVEDRVATGVGGYVLYFYLPISVNQLETFL
jgi:hypothetical protein